MPNIFRSICQRNSWRPLQVTRPMLDIIAAEHDIGASFWDLPSCFYQRSDGTEVAFCVPYTLVRNGSIIGTISSSSRFMQRKILIFESFLKQRSPILLDTRNIKRAMTVGPSGKAGSITNSISRHPKVYLFSSTQCPDLERIVK